MSNPLIVGIDLGTTNSLVAVAKEGVPQVLADVTTGETLLPSVVYFPDTNESPVAGSLAKTHFVTEPARTVYSAKRLMGKGYADVRAEAAHLTYTISPEREDVATIDLGDKQITAPEVAAYVLRALKERAEANLGENCDKSRDYGSCVF